MRFIELFCGIGGFRVGLERIGPEMKCVFSNDINHEACMVYSQRFGDVVEKDIREVNEDDIPPFDLLTAGFPCQPISSAGKGKGFDDDRGVVFFDIVRILKAKKPKAFILENVKNLLFHDGGNTLKVIVTELTKLGYYVDLALLDGKDFGVPQTRPRTYIIGVDEDPRPIFAEGMEKDPIVKSACKGLPVFCLFPKFNKVRSDLSMLRPTKKIEVPQALEEKIRRKIKSRPRSLIRVRDVRTGFQSIPTWTFDLFGETTPQEKSLLEVLRARFQKIIFDNVAASKHKAWVPKFKADTFTPGEREMLDKLSTMGYVRKYDDSYTLINRNILPNGLPSVYGGPKTVCPTLTASNLHKFAMVKDDGIFLLGPGEFESMQGFPQGHTDVRLDDKARCRLPGNAVMPSVVEFVGRTILKIS